MVRHPDLHKFLSRLGGYYLIPHELLHVLAYRLIGKPCYYRWGDNRVQSLQPKSRREKLFVLLFPFVICWVLGTFFGFLWVLSALFIDIPPERYFIEGPTWHLVFLIAGVLFILYSGTAHRDLPDAYAWLFIYQAEHDSPEPEKHSDKGQGNRHHPFTPLLSPKYPKI